MGLVELTPELALLRSTTDKFVASTLPVEEVRRHIDRGDLPGPRYRRDAAGIGWFAAFVPEEFGGGTVSGQPVSDAAVIAEQRGRALQPGPFVGTHVLAHALALAGSDRQREEILPALAGGEQTAAWVFPEPDASPGAPVGVPAEPTADGWRVESSGLLCHEPQGVDWFLVTVQAREAVELFVVPAAETSVRIRPVDGMDLSTRSGLVEFDRTRLGEEQRLVGAAEPLRLHRELFDLAALLTAIDSVGAMDRLLEMTVGYSLERRAFGRQIGSFQAVKHQLADLSMQLVSAKMLTRCAIEAVAAGAADAGEIVSMAKAVVSDAGYEIAQGCFQVHGGIGYAWEHDLHLYLRRLAGDSARFGDAAWHRERIVREHGL